MPDPQQDAAFREALLQMLAGAQAPHTPPPIAPVASHPASDAVLLESLRTRSTPTVPTSGPMGPTKIGLDPGFFGNLERQYAKGDISGLIASTKRVIDPANIGLSLDDVAARMGKPLGAFRTVMEQRPSGEYTLGIKDAVAKTYGGKPYEETAGWMDLGSNVIDDHLTVDNVFLYPEYRGKGLGSEIYQEAINEAKKLGHRGLASNPVTRNPMSERLWKDRPGVTESAGGRHELMSEYLPRLDPPRAATAPPPSQYVAPGQPHPLIRLLMEQKDR